ncbi:DUF4317 domain-containing protein [Clostridium sp. Marseille-P299]|uniref:DUF4317 domain-containing protein n=1 Tax=Clostridium sp. Marseille-P299 TaxID=1805477 RepID=UPI0008310099|nr:DUF4317 domain-containing protein [Clostridium sp. Marseille-P299]
MTKKDILELKRRLKKNECTFTKMCGCYVNADKEIILNFDETFLNLEDEEFYKYLEIAKKTLSGTVGNNLLELEFPLEEENVGGKQQFLMGLRESKLKNEALLESFYQLVIDNYDYTGNYLILIFHDAYDVMTKTSDNAKLDESEEVYEYLICAVCPVTLTKPGLGYLEIENRIGPRNRDWVVNPPETGFIFPAFTDRSTDIHSVMYFTKDTKEPHKEFVEQVLGCPPKQTATEQKNTFQAIINNAIIDEKKSEVVYMEIQETLNQMVDEQEEFSDSNSEPLLLTPDSIQDILAASDLPEEITTKIENSYVENFADTPPVVDHLIDNKVLAASAQRKKELQLFEQVQRLQERLEEVTLANNEEVAITLDEALSSIESNDSANGDFDVILKVKPQKVEQITSQIIDGKKCIIIPMDDDELANVNGITNLL